MENYQGCKVTIFDLLQCGFEEINILYNGNIREYNFFY